jgi:hypothetical protein
MNHTYRTQRRARLLIAVAFVALAAAFLVIGVTTP